MKNCQEFCVAFERVDSDLMLTVVLVDQAATESQAATLILGAWSHAHKVRSHLFGIFAILAGKCWKPSRADFTPWTDMMKLYAKLQLSVKEYCAFMEASQAKTTPSEDDSRLSTDASPTWAELLNVYSELCTMVGEIETHIVSSLADLYIVAQERLADDFTVVDKEVHFETCNCFVVAPSTSRLS